MEQFIVGDTILIAEKYQKMRNARMKELEDFNKDLLKVRRESKKVQNRITALNNKIKTLTSISKVEEVETQIEEFEKQKDEIDKEMQKTTIQVASKLLENVDTEELTNKLTILDSDLIMGLPHFIKLWKARTDEVKMNQFAADYIRNVTAKSLDNDYFR